MTTLAQFLATLPPALSRHGANYANDVTLAKAMRAEIALAVKRGVLPPLKVSVRINHHKSLTVEIVGWEGAVFSPDYEMYLMDEAAKPGSVQWSPEHRSRDEDPRLSSTLNVALRTIETIVERHNYNNSDLMTDYFDVGYYLTVTARSVEAIAANGIALELDPARPALLDAAAAAAAAIGPKATKAICGRRGLDGCSKWDLERLIKVATRANGRPVAFDKKRGAWLPTS